MKLLPTRFTRSQAPAGQPTMVSAGRRQLLKFVLLVALSFCSYLFFSRVVVTAVK